MPMMGRRRGPGLVRVAATTAVVAGTATAVSGHMKNSQQAKAEEQQQQSAQEQAAQAPPPAAGPVEETGEDETLATIEKLAEMRDKGIITDEEFAAKKAQLLGI